MLLGVRLQQCEWRGVALSIRDPDALRDCVDDALAVGVTVAELVAWPRVALPQPQQLAHPEPSCVSVILSEPHELNVCKRDGVLVAQRRCELIGQRFAISNAHRVVVSVWERVDERDADPKLHRVFIFFSISIRLGIAVRLFESQR